MKGRRACGGEDRLLPEHDSPYTDPPGGRIYIFDFAAISRGPTVLQWLRGRVVNTSIAVGSIALVLAGVLATGYAFGQEIIKEPPPTAQEKTLQREALRRIAVQEQQKRKDDFARNCLKPAMSDSQLEACRAAYRKL